MVLALAHLPFDLACWLGYQFKGVLFGYLLVLELLSFDCLLGAYSPKYEVVGGLWNFGKIKFWG